MHTFRVLPLSWSSPAQTHGRMLAYLQSAITGVGVCRLELLHGVAELGFTEQKECIAARDVGTAVPGGFG